MNSARSRMNINKQKFVTFLYTNNEIPERKSKNIIPFKIVSKKNPRNKLKQGGERPIC